MRDKLIKLLGGITPNDHTLLINEYEAQRSLCDVLRKENEFLTKRVQEEVSERKSLQEIIFKNYGVVAQELPSPGIDKELTPINTGRARWSNLKVALEKDDRKRVKAESKSSETEASYPFYNDL